MGFINSVSIAQHLHRGLVTRAMELAGVGRETELRRDKAVPRSPLFYRVYLDNFDTLQKVNPSAAALLEGRPNGASLALRSVYEEFNVPRNVKKTVEQQLVAEMQGRSEDEIGALRVALDVLQAPVGGYIAVESDAGACRVVEANFADVLQLSSVEEVTEEEVTTTDVKRQLSFKRHEREGSGMLASEESLAASKMNMLKRNPFDDKQEARIVRGKSFSESWKDAVRLLTYPDRGSCFERIAQGVVFKSLAMVAIVANTIYLGWAADFNVKNSFRRLQSLPMEPQSRVAEIAFAAWFTLELFIRALAEKLEFLTGDEKFWNALDFFLVSESLVSLAWDVPASLAFLRILRVFRLVRIVRLVRTVQALRKLRTMIFAMLNSFADLLWALQVVLLIVFVFSLIFNNAVAAHFDSLDASDIIAMGLAQEINAMYGGLYSSMVSLWSAVSGGNDWMVYAEALRHLSMGEFYFVIFNFYIAFCVIGLFNVVTGVFVDSAVCTRTEDEIVQGYLDEMKSMTESIKGFLKKADKDASGTLTYEEFQAHMSNPVVKAYFSGLDIDPDETKIIFTLLDSDCNGDIDIEEFVHGTMKLKGYATKLDVMALMYDATRQSIKFEALCEFLESQINCISDAVAGRPRRSSV
ncbi:unnamed protein product [Effrenium voratum]|nr:unnamed protein product [Effrenium voratum]